MMLRAAFAFGCASTIASLAPSKPWMNVCTEVSKGFFEFLARVVQELLRLAANYPWSTSALKIHCLFDSSVGLITYVFCVLPRLVKPCARTTVKSSWPSFGFLHWCFWIHYSHNGITLATHQDGLLSVPLHRMPMLSNATFFACPAKCAVFHLIWLCKRERIQFYLETGLGNPPPPAFPVEYPGLSPYIS